MNAAAVLEASEQFATVAEAIADCTLVVGTTAVGHRQLQHSLRRLEYGGKLIREELSSGRVALLFGSEKFGLSNEDMARCHWLMRIPTRAEHESMNLGQAVAICLYELIRSDEARSPPTETCARRQSGTRRPDRRPVGGGAAHLRIYQRRHGGVRGTEDAADGPAIALIRGRCFCVARDVRQILWKLKERR